MVAPNKPAKSAPKPPAKPAGNAPATTSIFAAMKKNATLAKHMAKAKQVQAVREFDGPDGDYPSVLSRTSHYEKDGSLGIVFEFRCTEGEYAEQKMVIFTIFKKTEYRTVEEIQNEFFEMLQLMGVDTNCDDAQLDAQLKTLIDNKSEITLRVKTSKKGSKFINVVGLATAAKEVAETKYVEETVEEVPEEATEKEAVDEWVDETAEEEAVEEVVEEVVEDEVSPPSAWVGYAMVYKGKEVEVLNADDETMKVTIKDGVKKLIVPFSALTPPPE